MLHVQVKSPDIPPPRARRTPSEDQSLLAQLHSLLGTRYAAFVVAIAVVLALLLALAEYAQAGRGERGGAALWMVGLTR